MSAHPQLSNLPGAKPTTERRRNRRRSIVSEHILPVSLDSDNGGLVVDLAEDGMAVQAVSVLQQGKAVELKFVLPESGAAIHAHGEVRWAELSGRAGIRLLAFSEGSAADIRTALLQLAPASQAEPFPDSRVGLMPPPDAPAATPTPTQEAEGRPRPLDAGSLECDIKSQGLDRESALTYIVERTREAVSASGVAIALGTREQMTCRASAGAAPSVGVSLQSNTGLSGECVHTGLVVCCDNTQIDARVDAAVCQQLNLRSAVLVPIFAAGKMCGVLEGFSSRAYAFTPEDVERFQQLAGLVGRIAAVTPSGNLASEAALNVTSLQADPDPPGATAAMSSTPAPLVAPKSPEEIIREALAAAPETSALDSSPGLSLAMPAMRYALVATGVLVLVLVIWGVVRVRRPASAGASLAVEAPAGAQAATTPAGAPQPIKMTPSRPSKVPQMRTSFATETSVAEGEEPALRQLPSVKHSQSDSVVPPMIVASDGRLPDLAAPAAQPVRAQPPSGEVIAGRLVRRVEPVYPDKARYAHVGGEVVLNAVVLPDGKVGSVKVGSGHPLLARAAIDAVRAWRYEPFLLNGAAVQGEVTIRLNFKPHR